MALARFRSPGNRLNFFIVIAASRDLQLRSCDLRMRIQILFADDNHRRRQILHHHFIDLTAIFL